MTGRRAGVSLLELMIVVALISTMVGGSMLYYDRVLEERKEGKVKTELIQLAKALKAYESRSGRPIKEYVDLPEKHRFDLNDLLNMQVMTEIPLDPWSQAYQINTTQGLVYSTGPDGTDGTGDEISHQWKPPFQAERAFLDSRVKSILIQFSRELTVSSVTTSTLTLEGVPGVTLVTAVVDIKNLFEAKLKLASPMTAPAGEVVIYPGVKARDDTVTEKEQRLPVSDR